MVTWVICWWWYRRKLRLLRQRLEARPSSEVSAPEDATEADKSHTVKSVDDLERTLNEANAKWERARPFLDTSPLPHREGEQR